MSKLTNLLYTGMLCSLMTTSLVAQDKGATKESPKEKAEAYKFTVVKSNEITPIQNQANSGTCWSFSGLGFIESEAYRLSGKKVTLSPMFIVAQSYKDKARDYVRYHGNLNFAQGGAFSDVLAVIGSHGIVPMEEMHGLNYGTKKHNHNELEKVSLGFLTALVEEMDKANHLSTAWGKAFDGIIDTYLGVAPSEFTFEGKKYTPKSFAQALKLDPKNYVSLTSYTHHPFYSKFVLEIPDNWRHSQSYNLPIEELMSVFDNALNNGYTIAWGSDVSEAGFTRDGLAVLLDIETASTRGSDQERWIGATPNKRRELIQELVRTPGAPEIKVTQEFRQEGFENLSTTDDHGMQIFGIAKDQTGKKFYMVKNSWGEVGTHKGIWYASESFVAGKTMNIVVHKDAIPKAIRQKLGI